MPPAAGAGAAVVSGGQARVWLVQGRVAVAAAGGLVTPGVVATGVQQQQQQQQLWVVCGGRWVWRLPARGPHCHRCRRGPGVLPGVGVCGVVVAVGAGAVVGLWCMRSAAQGVEVVVVVVGPAAGR